MSYTRCKECPKIIPSNHIVYCSDKCRALAKKKRINLLIESDKEYKAILLIRSSIYAKIKALNNRRSNMQKTLLDLESDATKLKRRIEGLSNMISILIKEKNDMPAWSNQNKD